MAEDYVDREDEEEEEEDDLAESTQHSVSPNSQELFLTQMELPSQPSQATIPDNKAMEGTSAANFSSPPTPSQSLAQIRRRKKKTRDEMFLDIMEVTRKGRAHLNEWKEMVSNYRKDASEREDRRDTQDQRWWQEDQRWRQEDQWWRDATLGCCVIKLTCSGVWWSFRNDSRITECRCSPCIITLTPHHVPHPPHPDV
ncbi:uncharacterized protein ACDP82_002293 [Pangshura tecta]